MPSKYVLSIIVVWALAGFLSGCTTEEKPDRDRIDQEVAHRIDQYKRHKRKKCIQAIVREVEASVDSTLLHEAMTKKEEAIPIPDPGVRPDLPEVGFPKFELKKEQ